MSADKYILHKHCRLVIESILNHFIFQPIDNLHSTQIPTQEYVIPGEPKEGIILIKIAIT